MNIQKTQKLFFASWIVFHSFIFDFILRTFLSHTLILSSWRPTKISCNVLCCSYLWDIKLYFCCNKWVNELHSANNAKPTSRNVTTSQNFLFWSLHSSKSTWCRNKYYTAILKQAICRETLIRSVRSRRKHNLHGKCLSGSAKLRCT